MNVDDPTKDEKRQQQQSQYIRMWKWNVKYREMSDFSLLSAQKELTQHLFIYFLFLFCFFVLFKTYAFNIYFIRASQLLHFGIVTFIYRCVYATKCTRVIVNYNFFFFSRIFLLHISILFSSLFNMLLPPMFSVYQ